MGAEFKCGNCGEEMVYRAGDFADEIAALRKRVEELERSIDAHHAAHVMRRQPGDVCPVCSPVVPLPQKYGDEIPKSLDMADLCQAAVARAEKAERRMEEEFQIAQQERRWRDEVQADLDAALDEMLGVSLTREQWVRVQSLLEKRREENRG